MNRFGVVGVDGTDGDEVFGGVVDIWKIEYEGFCIDIVWKMMLKRVVVVVVVVGDD